MTKNDPGSIDYKFELMRKGIHLCSLSFAVGYYYLSTELMLQILIPLTAFSLLIDFGRHYFTPLGDLFNRLFGSLLREHEKDTIKKNLSGASYVFLGVLITVIIFPKPFAILAIASLILCDLAAALVGRRFGKTKFLAKSLEGTLTFFIVGLVLVFLTPNVTTYPVEYLFAAIAIAVGALSENISYGFLDDNFAIPLSIGGTLWVLFTIFLPDVAIIYPNVPQ
ncbi:MAG: SEC59/DGK1/VTE5 family protein [Melioribacteraceae bacterium]|nr:SEC59/DGK1/VTE5 family protein [Melioribacteraceae bacterium]MCF8265536.1 SEC59/DGK1/VTE5 family protein [Melioribacteraceae bacterium]MCF8414197.1 SEC59/DGK1/VTE5 family protein [Melioribacteraceae bacterium]